MIGSRETLQAIVKAIILFLSITNSAAYGLYGNNNSSHVQRFNSMDDFHHRVLESSGISLIKFYSPWCRPCQRFEYLFEQIASILEGIVTVGVIDISMDEHLKKIVDNYDVNHPTLKLFKPSVSGGTVTDLKDWSPNGIFHAVMDSMVENVHERASSPHRSTKENYDYVSAVKHLSFANFDEQVYANPSVVAVAFVHPSCVSCVRFLQEWESAAEHLSTSDVMLATVDATEETQLAEHYELNAFPTIKIFPTGKKTKFAARDFVGELYKEQIVSELLAEVNGIDKEIPELTSQDIYDETCGSGGENIICVLVALPPILETGVEGRNKYKDTIIQASKAVRGAAFEFLWFEGGKQQLKLENALELTIGYPAVAAYSIDEEAYAVTRDSFTDVNLITFLTGIAIGKVSLFPLKEELVVGTESLESLKFYRCDSRVSRAGVAARTAEDVLAGRTQSRKGGESAALGVPKAAVREIPIKRNKSTRQLFGEVQNYDLQNRSNITEAAQKAHGQSTQERSHKAARSNVFSNIRPVARFRNSVDFVRKNVFKMLLQNQSKA